MKRLELPHRMADYLCPVNGLCDVYEWKTGKRIPEELIFYAKAGFQMISQKRADAPKMIFLGQGSIGKREYEFWKEIIGYEIMFGEGKCFRTTWKEICALLDREIPTILFGLDMFYLPYQQKFYQKQHIPGHVVLMVGYDDENAYIHDNSKEGVQPVPLSNLEQAWAKSYIGICKKNTYFGINMKSPETDISQIIQKGMDGKADMKDIFEERQDLVEVLTESIQGLKPAPFTPENTAEHWSLEFDRTEKGNSKWIAYMSDALKTARTFEIHCWNEEAECIDLALQYGKQKDTDWRYGKIIAGKVTPDFTAFLLGLPKPTDTEVYNKMTPFFTIALDNGFWSAHYGTELSKE